MDIPKLQSEAEAGDAIAQTHLGIAYLDGTEVSKDFATAQRWLTVAAEKNTPLALLHLGRMHQAGWGVSLELHKALDYFQRAAEGGEWLAYIHIARMHRYGRGTPTDEEKASYWYYTAISKSNDTHPRRELEEAIDYVQSLNNPPD